MEIKVEVFEDLKFRKLTCPENHFITSYEEGGDIKDYNSSQEMYIPLDMDIEVYHCITKEEDEKYLKLREEQLKKYRDEKLAH